MHPTELSPVTPVPREAIPDGLSRDRLRDICYRSVNQTSDAELDNVAFTALDDIERMTGLKLFPGSFEARFPIYRRPEDADRDGVSYYTDGLQVQRIYRRTILDLPGVNVTNVVVTTPTGTVVPRKTIPDEAGNLQLLPPTTGWLAADAPDLDFESSVTVTFNAGGSIPRGVVQAIGLQMQWLFNQEPEDEAAARRRARYYAFRFEI